MTETLDHPQRTTALGRLEASTHLQPFTDAVPSKGKPSRKKATYDQTTTDDEGLYQPAAANTSTSRAVALTSVPAANPVTYQPQIAARDVRFVGGIFSVRRGVPRQSVQLAGNLQAGNLLLQERDATAVYQERHAAQFRWLQQGEEASPDCLLSVPNARSVLVLFSWVPLENRTQGIAGFLETTAPLTNNSSFRIQTTSGTTIAYGAVLSLQPQNIVVTVS